MKKKIFSLLLALAIVFGVFIPVNIFPETEIVADAGIALTVYDWDTLKDELARTGPAELKLGDDLTLKKDLGSYQEGVFLKVRGDKVLDLNGFSITVLDYSNVESNKDVSHICESTVFYVNGGNLTINDSKGGGTISNDGYYISPAVLLFDNAIYYGRTERHLFHVYNGALTINGGTYIAGGAKEQYLSDEVCYAHLINPGYIVTSDENAVITINDGNFTAHGLKQGKYSYGGILYNISSSAKADIYGGNFHVKGETGIINWYGDLNIYNGTFKMSRFSKIRRPCSYDLDANNVSDCESAEMNIHDSYWNSDYTKVYLDNKLLESLEKDQFKNYTGTGSVRFSSVVLKGETKLSSATIYVGDKASVEFTGQVQKLYERSPSSFTYNWQVKKNFEWEDIKGANSKDYVTTKDVVGYKIRCRIQIKGYPNAFSTNYGDVIKLQNNKSPLRPAVSVDYAKGKFKILDLANHPDQEFVFCATNTQTWPSKDTAITVSLGDGYTAQLTKNKTYYLYTRFKATDTHEAGSKIYIYTFNLAETIYLQGIDLYCESESVEQGEKVKICVDPYPLNTTNFDGIVGQNWYINSSKGAKLCDKNGNPLKSGVNYKEVYIKGGTAAEIAVVRAEYTKGYNDIATDSVKINVQGADGTYAFASNEINIRYNGNIIGNADEIIIERGSSVIVQLNNRDYPGKPISKVNVLHYSGNNLSGLGFEYAAGNDYLRIEASETAQLGSGIYKIVVNGTEQSNRIPVKVVDKNIPLEKVTLDKTSFITGVGETTQLTASVSPYNATNAEITWNSSDTSVATVTDSGAVTAKKVGTAKITATADGKTATCSVVVSEKVKKYKVDVEYGTANAEYASKGTTVTVTADAAKSGFVFDKWMSSSVSFANASSATTSFTMPAGAVAVTATYKAVEYTVSVTNGTASAKKATIGTKVTITAGSNFCIWSVTGATVQNAKSSSTSFTMGSENVVVVAKGHSLTKVAAVKATCIKNGTIEHYKCSFCQKLFSDSAAKKEITDITAKATGHKYEWVVTKPAAVGVPGEKANKCKTCGDVKETQKISALEPEYMLGDVDADKSVSAADARLALRASVDLEKLSAIQKKAADADKDTNITAADARLILRASVGLENLK